MIWKGPFAATKRWCGGPQPTYKQVLITCGTSMEFSGLWTLELQASGHNGFSLRSQDRPECKKFALQLDRVHGSSTHTMAKT